MNLTAFSNVSTSSAHNTDGWDVYRSDQVVLKDSIINNDDDCVSFKPSTYLFLSMTKYVQLCLDSTNILVENLDCTGSQYALVIYYNLTVRLINLSGISVGSLGQVYSPLRIFTEKKLICHHHSSLGCLTS